MNRRGRKTGFRLFTGLLAAGILMVQPTLVFAENAVVCEAAEASIQARIPGSGEVVDVSENVRAMLEDGSIYLDEDRISSRHSYGA